MHLQLFYNVLSVEKKEWPSSQTFLDFLGKLVPQRAGVHALIQTPNSSRLPNKIYQMNSIAIFRLGLIFFSSSNETDKFYISKVLLSIAADPFTLLQNSVFTLSSKFILGIFCFSVQGPHTDFLSIHV